MTPRAAALLLALAAAASPTARAGEGARPSGGHPSFTVESCLACHPAGEVVTISPRVARPCRTLCASCHGMRDGHHPVGVRIGRKPSAPLLLTASDTNTCVTCHDTTKPRVDSSPWESQSLFARVAWRSKEHPTRFLAMKNDKGQLCRACH